MVAIRAGIGREEQEGVVCGPVTDSLLEHPTLKSRGLTWIETYLGLPWLAESWENRVALLFFGRFRWAPKAEKKTAPTEDLN